MAASDLFDLAAEVKQVAEEILATTSEGVPDVSLITHGQPALDCCDMLALHVAAIGEAPTTVQTPLDAGQRVARVNLTTLLITITRCWPVISGTLTPPTAAKQQQAAQAIYQDAWALWCGLYRQREEVFGHCALVFFDGLIPLEPQGGCAGWVFAIRFELPGYDPLSGS